MRDGKKYLQRVIDEELTCSLKASGAVLIEGEKWCGKTRSSKEKAASIVYMQDPDKAISNIRLADTMPSLLLRGETPRLIDEWQVVPNLWDVVRFSVDERGLNG